LIEAKPAHKNRVKKLWKNCAKVPQYYSYSKWLCGS